MPEVTANSANQPTPAASTTPTAAAVPTAAPFTRSLTPEAIEITKQFGWDFFKAGVLVVDEWPDPPAKFEDDPETQYRLIREAKIKERQPDGTKKWVLSDQGKWNLPCGRLQPGESIEAAALREGQEETGYTLELGDLCHIGHRRDNDNPYVIFIYAATERRFIASPDPEEIAATCWFTYDEIIALRDAGQLRNPDLTLGAINQYRQRKPIPRSLIMTYPSD